MRVVCWRAEARGQTPAAVTLDQLLRMSPAQIESVYRQGIAVAIPEGRVEGRPSGTGDGRARLSRERGFSGKGRCSSPAGPPPSTASSACG